ncbi:MAG: ABC transporter ATP-binding protein [Chloroflexota bacterium]
MGQFTLYTQTISRFGGTLSQLMLQMTALHEDNLFLGNLFRFLALEPIVEAPRCSALQHPIRPHPSITFQDVSFRYPNTDRDILHQVSFTIDPGESVAVVGHNGAGKSTIVKLLTGLYEPTDGCILLDGIDIRQLDRATLRSYMSFVLQDFVIYAFSAYDNIAMGHLAEQENQERVRAAARDSNLETVIEALPQRYETIIARFLDTGVELSGGQRQSIAVARALMRQAPILIMDEPSAALDIYKERAFFEQLLTQRPDSQTVIFISHRFSTVRRADRILVLDNGALVENGTHETLLHQRGRYAEMFQLQVEMYGIEQDQKTTGDTTTMPVAVASSIEEV